MWGEFDYFFILLLVVIVCLLILFKLCNLCDDCILFEEVWDQLCGIEGCGWLVFGDKMIVDYLVEFGNKVDVLVVKFDVCEGFDWFSDIWQLFQQVVGC